MSVMVGALAFLAIHFIEVQKWATWFGGVHQPWFLNDQTATDFTLISLFVLSIIAGGFYLTGPWIVSGVLVGMIVALFSQSDGPGTLFPIVLAIGTVFALIVCWPGAFIGKELRDLLTRSHASR
jgi:hypothetical protein